MGLVLCEVEAAGKGKAAVLVKLMQMRARLCDFVGIFPAG